MIKQMRDLEEDMESNEGEFAMIKAALDPIFAGAPRLKQGWAVAVYFTRKVCIEFVLQPYLRMNFV